jgi:thiamine kinase-like enzyme
MESTNPWTKEDYESIKTVLPSWKLIPIEKIRVSEMGLGVSSIVYKVEIDSSFSNNTAEPKIFVYRKFKLDRQYKRHSAEKENQIYEEMAKIGVGPQYYGGSESFRIEEFLDTRIIKSYEINLPELRRRLAIKMCMFHKAKIEIESKEGHIELFLKNERMQGLIKENLYSEDYKLDQMEEVKKLRYLYEEEERTWLLSILPKDKYVLSHNDIWVGNILLDENQKHLYLIDFEMVAYNFPGYDVGKLLLEPMSEREPSLKINMRYDLMPIEEEIKDFARFYLNTLNIKDEVLSQKDMDLLVEKFSSESISEDEEEKINIFLREIYLGMMVSGYYMAMLGMFCAKFQTELDFLKFAVDGHLIYLKYKEKLFH